MSSPVAPSAPPSPPRSSGRGRADWVRWLYPIALAIMIVVASGRGQVAGPEIVNFDKAAHFAVFGLLASLVVRAPGLRHAWWAVLGVSFFGLSDEFRQSFTPGRAVEAADWVADTAGAIVAVLAYTLWPWYRRCLETPLRWPRRKPAAQKPAAQKRSANTLPLSTS